MKNIIGRVRPEEKIPPTALRVITTLLTLALLAVWGAGMLCLTSVTAEYAAARYLNDYRDFASTIAARSFEPWLGKGYSDSYQNYDLSRIWEAVDDGGQADLFGGGYAVYENAPFFHRPDSGRADSAAAVYDAQGNLLACSWSDFFYFEYLTEQQWKNGEERSGNYAQAAFRREYLTAAGEEIVCDSSLTLDAAALRFTGSFDGTAFTPRKIEAVDETEFREVAQASGGGQYVVSRMVEDHDMAWIVLYEDPNAALSGEESVVFYTDSFDVCYHSPSPAFAYDGARYPGADRLAARLGTQLASGLQHLVRYEGADLLIPSVNYCISVDGRLCYTPYYHGDLLGESEQEVRLHFYTVSVVYCSPWRTALGELWMVYLGTLLLTVALVLVLRGVIWRHLIEPVQAVGDALLGDGKTPFLYSQHARAWQESRRLQDGLEQYRDTIGTQENEITRLNAALEYARTAEENRRRMTSNIAHELKTPLAVIHSYAEGLKEHIAEEKRDHYLDVILSEAERTDGMVLEMLDLSRLEAGKVRLSRDTFSLSELAESVFEKLAITAQAKRLQIRCEFSEPYAVVADEGRMTQVIENFATNAMKYTPDGGSITVRIGGRRGKTSFSIENESQPLSEEALTRVWDTFYRMDEARSGTGTGLGLAIARSIVELHGGKCFVKNTKTGVEFGFEI